MLNRDDFSLRRLRLEDEELILFWRNQDFIRENMFSDHIITAQEHHAWFMKTLQAQEIWFRIFEYKNKPIGISSISDIKNCGGFWGFYIGDKGAPKGSGSILAELSIDEAFNRLGLKEIRSEAFDFNEKSIKLHEKFGFEKCAKNARSKNGEIKPTTLFILKREKWGRDEN